EVLLAQLADLLPLLARQPFTPALIDLDSAHVQPQRLRRETKVSRDMRDRPPRLEHQAGTAIQQLRGVLPRTWHDQTLLLPPGKTWHRSLRQNRPGSVWRLGRGRLRVRLWRVRCR